MEVIIQRKDLDDDVTIPVAMSISKKCQKSVNIVYRID